MEDALAPLRADIGHLQENIGHLQSSVSVLQSSVSVLQSSVSVLQSGVGRLEEGLLVPAGDTAAQEVTVRVVSGGSHVGHGAVAIKRDGAESKYFLLSAAHVLTCVGETVELTRGNTTVTATRKKLHVHMDYVLTGAKDFGFMEIGLNGGEGHFSASSCESLGPPDVGQSVVAHGQVYLRGAVTSYSGDDAQFTVLAHSVSGSSGSPLLNNKKILVGVVDGSTKHRASRHNSNAEDHSAVVFCQSIIGEKLHSVSDATILRWLHWAEDVDLAMADDGLEGLGKKEAPDKKKRDILKLAEALGVKNSIRELMNVLGKHVQEKCEDTDEIAGLEWLLLSSQQKWESPTNQEMWNGDINNLTEEAEGRAF